MHRLLVVLIVVLLAPFLRAQVRQASVQLDDGQIITGTVLAMDLSTLQIQVGHEKRTIEATRKIPDVPIPPELKQRLLKVLRSRK